MARTVAEAGSVWWGVPTAFLPAPRSLALPLHLRAVS